MVRDYIGDGIRRRRELGTANAGRRGQDERQWVLILMCLKPFSNVQGLVVYSVQTGSEVWETSEMFKPV